MISLLLVSRNLRPIRFRLFISTVIEIDSSFGDSLRRGDVIRGKLDLDGGFNVGEDPFPNGVSSTRAHNLKITDSNPPQTLHG